MTTQHAQEELVAVNDFEFAALESAENYRKAVLSEFARYLRGDVVEIGAGVGHISQHIAELAAVRSIIAIEPSAQSAEKFRQRLPNVTLVQGTVDELDPASELDAIVSINVLEHVREDQRELVKYARLLCARGGHLCLFVPARQEIYAPMDRDFGHYRRYVKPQLRSQLQGAGFEVLRLDYFNCVGYFAWWLNFCVLRQRTFDVRKVVLFDRVIFPVVHALESRLGAPPFGQSLIAICRALPKR